MVRNRTQTDFRRLFSGSFSGLATFLLLIFTCLYHPDWQNTLENLAGDQLRRSLAKPLTPGIELVYIDEASLKQAERDFGVAWPWPRNVYGQVVDYLKYSGARAVIFDFLFNSASTQGRDDDQAFAAALKRDGAVFSGFLASQAPMPESMKEFRALPRQYDLPVYALKGALPSVRSIDAPKLPLWGAFAGLGDVTFIQDNDGTGRRQRVLVDLDGRFYPSLAFSAYWSLLGRPALSFDGGQLSMGSASMRLLPDATFHLLFRKEPADDGRRITLYDLARSEAALLEKKAPLVAPARLRGKIVIIGSTAPGLVDLRPSPMSKQSPGFYLNAVALDNLLTGHHLTVMPLNTLGWLAILFFCIFISMLGFRLSGLLAGLIPAMLGGVVWLAYWAYQTHDTLIPIATPVAAIFLSAGLSSLEHYLLEYKRRKSIQTAFGQFLSPAVFHQLLADRKPLQTGGEKHDLTVFFSDLQGFTSFSEKLDPTRLVDILNYYLTEMGEVIVGQALGYVDKYEGDAIMAFWGAPTPNPAHALAACKAAWLCQQRLRQIQPELAKRGLDTGEEGLVMRIGINTGDAVVGLMGSPRKLNYTAMGDTVNLASRLEGTNKTYGSRILLSEATHAAAGAGLLARELDLIRVKGKQEPTRIYELVGFKDSKDQPLVPASALQAFASGLGLYRAGNFAQARAAFESCLQAAPGDGPSRAYIQRCAEYEQDAPPAGWDGVYIMKTK